MGDTTLAWTFLGPEENLPEGLSPLKAVAPARAGLRIDEGSVEVFCALPDASAAEARWVAGKLSQRLRQAFPIGATSVGFGEGIAPDLALTLALDQHLASAGRLETGRPLPGLEAHVRGLDLFRSWVDEGAETRTSLAIARDVEAFASDRREVSATVLDEAALREAGLHLLLTVGGASRISPPRLVVARWLPDDPRPPLLLLGKGITFDSGGINVKPYESFVSMMKNDMAGSALAWTLFTELVRADHDRPVAVVLPTCENPIGEEAVRPGTVVRGYKGLRVRIDHTDAEGRLVLADGLAWADEHLAPSEVLSFATLTTAALIAYGPYATPVHFAEPDLEDRLREAGDALGEDLHFFPSRVWHTEANRDEEADLVNTASLPKHANRSAGSRNAAHFLRFFTERPLAHFDIFASTWNWAGDAPGAGPGSTGAPLRTLLRALGVA